MNKDILLELLKQNQFTSHFSLDRVTEENARLRLNGRTASIGFIYRHIGETIHLFGQFFGVATDVKNTTMGQIDNGQHEDVAYSRELIERGYQMLKSLVENSSEEDWMKPVDTPFFGTVSRVRLFGHIRFHTSKSCRTDIPHASEGEVKCSVAAVFNHPSWDSTCRVK
jgi:hypothetical protein